jgi:DHA1 family tetracycline resistance protein-like MFS transporter
MSKALVAIFGILIIDSMGIGVIMPILPSLIRDVGHLQATGWQYGALISLYAAMQFLFAPLLGALSDRYGRRPVLLVSLAGAAIDYVVMAFAPGLVFLFIGRAISGMTGANQAVASAYITDITPEADRAKRFGQVSAIFGIGFILGPVLGGVLGAHWVRLPFLAAAVLNAVNFLFVALVVPESRKGSKDAVVPGLSFLGPVKPLKEFGFMWKLIVVAVIFGFVGEVAGTIWVLYAEDKFAWDPTMIGISLTAFGVFHIASQAVMVGPVGKILGQRGGLISGSRWPGRAGWPLR